MRMAAKAVVAARVGKRAADLKPLLDELSASGSLSLGAIAHELTKRKVPTAKGAAKWSAVQVQRVLKAAV